MRELLSMQDLFYEYKRLTGISYGDDRFALPIQDPRYFQAEVSLRGQVYIAQQRELRNQYSSIPLPPLVDTFAPIRTGMEKIIFDSLKHRW